MPFSDKSCSNGHHDVFVSYSSVNKLIADAACAMLEAQAIRCWIAPRDIMPAQDWSDAIIDAIAECRVFLLILSSASNQSEQVKREVQNAVSEAKYILPMRIEDVALSKHMRYFIGTPHWLDALSPPMEHHLERMAGTIHTLLTTLEEKPGAIPPVPSPSLPGMGLDRAAPPVSTFAWDPQQLKRIESELSQFVGPISSTLVRQSLPAAKDYHDLCSRLAEDALTEQERHSFLTNCLSLFPAFQSPSATTDQILPAPRETTSVPSQTLAPEVLMAAVKALSNYVGPLAKILVKEAAKSTSDRDEFYQLLMEQVTSPQEKASLLRDLKRI